MQLSSGIRVCLKVPTVGQEGRWGSNSAQALRSEALTMQYIRTHSSFPVPKVHGFDTTFANEIQAPFILIGFILGSSVEDTFNKWVEEGVYEQKSANLLESLANCMANLGELRFSKIGMLEFLDPSGEPETFGPYGTSKELFSARFRILNKQVWTDEYEGMYEILELCFSCLPASSDGSTTGAESFGICHPDLAFQNIFCDDEGNITGIIDWDGVYVGPLYMGCYSFPLWLREDWQRDYIWPYGDPFLSPDELAESRAVYSSAMRKFMSTHDSWLYPDKSLYLMALYDILAVPGGKHACRSYMRKLFQLVLPTVDPESFFSRLANVEGDETDHGWIVTNYVDAKEYLVERITRLYQCNQKSSASTPGLIQGELGRKPLANMATPTPYYAPPRSCRDPAHNNRSAHDDRSSRSGHMIGHEATTHSPSLAIKLKEKHQDGLVVKDDQDDQDSSKHDEENSEDSWVSSDMEPSVGQEDLDAEYNARCSAELADSPQLGAKGRSPTHSPPKLGVMRSDYMNPSAWLGSKS
ncbi:hypothetical protein EJ08DRAFT_615439 [Tothia fuscella]|uniref:Aminoglycoside phosphotransferase domain-containing protein n=1 Tax=Tothia fuscella TaxID=1048955 RepID=A0A9P4TX21_9PEZI|nr:hypothetical protein EJ08DRAFT_615439 [Tothia fuscella]